MIKLRKEIQETERAGEEKNSIKLSMTIYVHF